MRTIERFGQQGSESEVGAVLLDAPQVRVIGRIATPYLDSNRPSVQGSLPPAEQVQRIASDVERPPQIL